jgi:plasmid stabilization system protein ParE
MTIPIIFRRTAQDELDDAGDWYEKERQGLGEAFFNSIEDLLKQIADRPNQFPMLYRDVHKAVVKRFPYCVYFRVRNRHITVLAVFHTARNPAVWKMRALR